MKLPYKEWQKCRRHPEQAAATCSECYDAALLEQQVQVMRDRRRAHSAWMRAQAVAQ